MAGSMLKILTLIEKTVFTYLLPLALILKISCERCHLPDIGPFDELNAEEISNVYQNLGAFLGLKFIEGHFYLPQNKKSDIFATDNLARVIHIALEVPSKHFRQGSRFQRFARVALYSPEKAFVYEYIVSSIKDVVNVTKVRKIPAIKRPVDEVESDNLQFMLHQTCSGEFGRFLKEFYGASFLFMGTLEPIFNECVETSEKASKPASYPKCLFAMYASPTVIMRKPNRRIATFRLNRFVPPYNQHPIDVYITIDHTETEAARWKIDHLLVQNQEFSSMEDFLKLKPNWSHIFRRITFTTSPFNLAHTVRLGPDLCLRSQSFASNCDSQNSFKGRIVNKHIIHGPWELDLGVRHETGLRFYNVHFNGELVIAEAGMDETATIYGGDTPFMQSMISLESMFGVGSRTSELSPGIDCPENAVFLSVPIIASLSEGARTVQNGICVYESSANVHDGPLHRYYQEFDDAYLSIGTGYGTGKVAKSLYIVTQAAIFNYQYAFVNVFSPTGSYACYVVPSGYIHVDIPRSSEHHYGFVVPRLDLRFNIHTHNFLFFIDALGSNNMIEQTRVYAQHEKHGFDVMNMEVKRLLTEKEGRLEGSDQLTKTAICLGGKGVTVDKPNSRCMNIANFATIPSLLTEKSSRSFAWIRKSMWLTKYKDEELRASSIYNGVDLTDPVVDFANFSTNESLEGDVVIWINAGFIHIPVNEDIPQTPSKNSHIGFMLRPANFFPQSPDSLEPSGHVFTANKRKWINGYVPNTHPDCEGFVASAGRAMPDV
ncbi:hypothetical protein Aperf_G00000057923 [Anoplocephala perfoliata]